MTSKWTFSRMIAVGFACAMALTLMVGVIALIGMRSVVNSKDRVINVDTQLMVKSEQMLSLRNQQAAALRGYLLTGDIAFRDEAVQTAAQFEALIEETRQLVHTVRGKQLIDDIVEAAVNSEAAQNQLIKVKQDGASPAEVVEAFVGVSQQRIALKNLLVTFGEHERNLTAAGVLSSNKAAARDSWMIGGVLVLATLSAMLLAVVMTRRLRLRIGSAVGEVQSSSAELASTANQQAVGAMEQATAMGRSPPRSPNCSPPRGRSPSRHSGWRKWPN